MTRRPPLVLLFLVLALASASSAALATLTATGEITLARMRRHFNLSAIVLDSTKRLPLAETIARVRAISWTPRRLRVPPWIDEVKFAYAEPWLEGLPHAAIEWYRPVPASGGQGGTEPFVLLGASNGFPLNALSGDDPTWMNCTPDVLRRWLETKDAALVRRDTLARLGWQVGQVIHFEGKEIEPVDLHIVGVFDGQMPANFVPVHFGYVNEHVHEETHDSVGGLEIGATECNAPTGCGDLIEQLYRALPPPVKLETVRDRVGRGVEMNGYQVSLMRLLSPFVLSLLLLCTAISQRRLRELGGAAWPPLWLGAIFGAVAVWLSFRHGLPLGRWAFQSVSIEGAALAIGISSVGIASSLLSRWWSGTAALPLAATIAAAGVTATLSLHKELVTVTAGHAHPDRIIAIAPPLPPAELERITRELTNDFGTAPSIERNTTIKTSRSGTVETFRLRGVDRVAVALRPEVELGGPPGTGGPGGSSAFETAPPLSLWASPGVLDRLGRKVGDSFSMFGARWTFVGTLRAPGSEHESEIWGRSEELAPFLEGAELALIFDAARGHVAEATADVARRFPALEVSTEDKRQDDELAFRMPRPMVQAGLALLALSFLALMAVGTLQETRLLQLRSVLGAAFIGVAAAELGLRFVSVYYAEGLLHPPPRLLIDATAMGFVLGAALLSIGINSGLSALAARRSARFGA